MMRSCVAVGWILAVALVPATVAAQTSRPSFGKDIAPILYERCAMCHRAGEVAPMSLMSYDEVRPWARAIKSKVVARQMPPWYAEGEAARWQNDRRLSQAEIDKIVAWVDAGAPRGNDAVPAPPQFAQGWNHPSGKPPDLIIEAPVMEIKAEGENPWQYAYAKLPFTADDVWIGAMQIVPGNRKMVHHVLVTSATLAPDTVLDSLGRVQVPPGASVAPGGRGASNAPRAPQAGAAGAATTPRIGGGLTVTWEPGVDTAVVLPPGVAERLSGTHLSFNVHYQSNGQATTDKTRVGLWLQKGPITHVIGGGGGGFGGDAFIVNDQELLGRYSAQITQDVLPAGTKTVPNIRAGEENYRLTNLLPIRQEVSVYTIQPHMHLRGKSMKYTAVYPDGREEVLLNVPHYDFNWQIIYAFAKPVTLPAGTTVRVEAVWDNSVKNKYNPRPDQEVFWGEQSWDEMLSPILRTAVKLPTPVIPTPLVQTSQQ
jgi:hypothetical protein